VQASVREGFAAAIRSGFWTALIAVIIGFFVVLAIPGRPLRDHPSPARMESEEEAELEAEVRPH
jgi:hypothetical protein